MGHQAMTAGAAEADDDRSYDRILMIVGIVVSVLMLIAIGYYVHRRKKRRSSFVTRDSMAHVLGRESAAQHQIAVDVDTQMATEMGVFEGKEVECSVSEVAYLSQDEV